MITADTGESFFDEQSLTLPLLAAVPTKTVSLADWFFEEAVMESVVAMFDLRCLGSEWRWVVVKLRIPRFIVFACA